MDRYEDEQARKEPAGAGAGSGSATVVPDGMDLVDTWGLVAQV